MLKIPFYKPSIGPEEIDEVVATLKSGWLTTGPKTKQFEREFAGYLTQKHAIAVNSCTAALHLALEAIGLKAGQGVVVPTMTFAATAEVVRYFNARPILVDCLEADFNFDLLDADRKIQNALAGGLEVAAIIPVHFGGQVGDVAGVRALAQRYQLKIVEDAAHCCPAYYRIHTASPLSASDGGDLSGLGSSERNSLEAKAHEGGVSGHDRVSGGVRCVPAPPTSDLRPLVTGDCSVLCPPRLDRGESDATLAHRMGEGLGERASAEASSPSTLNSQLPTLNSPADNGWLPVGHDADITCFSFYANKTITTGEGGMACTQNDEYADRMRIMSLHGISRDAWKRFTAEGSWYYEIIAPGFKYNLTDIASAIGIHQLRKADLFHRRRTELARQYSEALTEVEEIILPQVQPNRIHSWHLYVIRLRLDRLKIDRAQFITELQQRGIGTSVHWLPLHMHPYYRETYGYAPQDLPTAANLYPELITLPLYPDMTEGDIVYVSEAIKQIIANNLRPTAALG